MACQPQSSLKSHLPSHLPSSYSSSRAHYGTACLFRFHIDHNFFFFSFSFFTRIPPNRFGPSLSNIVALHRKLTIESSETFTAGPMRCRGLKLGVVVFSSPLFKIDPPPRPYLFGPVSNIWSACRPLIWR